MCSLTHDGFAGKHLFVFAPVIRSQLVEGTQCRILKSSAEMIRAVRRYPMGMGLRANAPSTRKNGEAPSRYSSRPDCRFIFCFQRPHSPHQRQSTSCDGETFLCGWAIVTVLSASKCSSFSARSCRHDVCPTGLFTGCRLLSVGRDDPA